ncbi:MAG: rod shape-determining protein MreD [Spirochaetaceae bacterium]|nr:rod shape-determining protein MreD [Spirochaetaceae bacterium]
MKKSKLVPATIVMLLFVLLETTLLKKLPSNYIYPDIALIILIFFSNSRGVIEGQVSGFLVGIAEDFLSLSPPGFNSFIKTIIGFIFGNSKGKIFIDPIFFPMLMVFIATLIKGFTAVIISSVFLSPETSPDVFTVKFGIEIIENCICAPFVFAFMKLIKFYTFEDRGF